MAKDTTPEKKVALTLKNYHLTYLFDTNPSATQGNWLNTPLHNKQARARNRFLKIISERNQELEDNRMELLKQYCKKDKEGEPVMKKTDNGLQEYDFVEEDYEKFQKEYGEMQIEDFIIDILPSNKEDIMIVRDILDDLKKPLELRESFVYEEVMTAFEKI